MSTLFSKIIYLSAKLLYTLFIKTISSKGSDDLSFSEVLDKAIQNSSLTSKEIIEKCQDNFNVKLSDSYLSQLKTGKQKNPSPEISIALANILGLDEKLLLIESQLENIPEEITEFLNIIYMASSDTVESPSSTSLAEFIIMVKDNYDNEHLKSPNRKLSLKDVFGFLNKLKEINENYRLKIDNDSMEPIIPRNSRVKYISHTKDSSYNSMDLIIFTDFKRKKYYLKRFIQTDCNIIFAPVNSNDKSKVFIFDDFKKFEKKYIIKGKVVSYVHDFE